MKNLSMAQRSNLALSRVIDLTHAEFMGQVGIGASLWKYAVGGPTGTPRAAIINTPFGLCLAMVIVENNSVGSALGAGPFILDGAKNTPDFISPSDAEYLASVAKNHYNVNYALVAYYSKTTLDGKMMTKIIPLDKFRNMVAHACFEQQHQPDPSFLAAAVAVHNVFAKLTELPDPWRC